MVQSLVAMESNEAAIYSSDDDASSAEGTLSEPANGHNAFGSKVRATTAVPTVLPMTVGGPEEASSRHDVISADATEVRGPAEAAAAVISAPAATTDGRNKLNGSGITSSILILGTSNRPAVGSSSPAVAAAALPVVHSIIPPKVSPVPPRGIIDLNDDSSDFDDSDDNKERETLVLAGRGLERSVSRRITVTHVKHAELASNAQSDRYDVRGNCGSITSNSNLIRIMAFITVCFIHA